MSPDITWDKKTFIEARCTNEIRTHTGEKGF